MIAVDTNILVYSHRPESPLHESSDGAIRRLVSMKKPWGIPCHCLIEFAAVVSNPKIWKHPSEHHHIAGQVDAWRVSPDFRILGDDDSVWNRCAEIARQGHIQAARWYDARIAAICLSHGVTELWTVDRDYSRFPLLTTRNPLVEARGRVS